MRQPLQTLTGGAQRSMQIWGVGRGGGVPLFRQPVLSFVLGNVSGQLYSGKETTAASHCGKRNAPKVVGCTSDSMQSRPSSVDGALSCRKSKGETLRLPLAIEIHCSRANAAAPDRIEALYKFVDAKPTRTVTPVHCSVFHHWALSSG